MIPGDVSMAALLSTLPQPLTDRLKSARDLVRSGGSDAERELLFATTVPALDCLLVGGLARGELVELIGRRTSGRFSLALATLAAATRIGESVALIDLGDHFDPQAADDAGVELERLLWLRPRHMRQALAGAEIVIGGGFPLVVLDLGAPPVPGGRGAEASWLRLARAARAHTTALLVSSPYRVSGTAARIVLAVQGARGLWHGRENGPECGRQCGRECSWHLLEGLSSRIAREKFRGHSSGQEGVFGLRIHTGMAEDKAEDTAEDTAKDTAEVDTVPEPSPVLSFPAFRLKG